MAAEAEAVESPLQTKVLNPHSRRKHYSDLSALIVRTKDAFNPSVQAASTCQSPSSLPFTPISSIPQPQGWAFCPLR